MAPSRGGQAVLDGGWWPRSSDPVAELPGLVLALSDRYGPIRNVMLNSSAWDSRFRKLAVGAAIVRMGWFTSLDTALLIATTDRGDQIDLLVVPPTTSATAAEQAMSRAADPTNTTHAPDILAATSAVPVTGAGPSGVRDNKDGRTAEGVAQRPANKRSTASSS
jgi:hypothetical protein